MTIRVAINGFGRIGRNVLRAHYEDGKSRDLEIVAVNTRVTMKSMRTCCATTRCMGALPRK